MFFHIANAVSPRSFLDDAEYLGGCFLRLLDIAVQQFGAERIATRSWLNSLPAWLAFFPAEYLNNRQPPNRDVRWYGSFWGQFINARGTFNSRYGQIMRRTGCFPYAPCYAECSIPAMRRHIVSVISTQGKHIK